MKSGYSRFSQAALLASLMTLTGQGATLLTQLSTPNRGSFNGTVGTTFTVGASSLSVTALGFQDLGENGLVAAHQVGLWNVTTNALVASVNLPITTGSDGTFTSGGYRYLTLPSAVTLTAGQAYAIGAFVLGADLWTDVDPNPGVSVSADVVGADARYFAGSFASPITDGAGTSNFRWGPANMQYSVVPEPGVWSLLPFAAAATCFVRRRK